MQFTARNKLLIVIKLNFTSKLMDLCVQTDIVHGKDVTKSCILNYGVSFFHMRLISGKHHADFCVHHTNRVFTC